MPKTHLKVNGKAIQVIRELSGLTGAEVADQAGCDRTHLVHIEAGRKQPSPALAKRLADALKISLGTILLGPNDE